jgi:hypothetical protein
MRDERLFDEKRRMRHAQMPCGNGESLQNMKITHCPRSSFFSGLTEETKQGRKM